MSSLRPIAVYVEEPRPGRFEWVLAERHGETWRDLRRADPPLASYKEAMARGLVALQGIVEDLEVGPRTEDAPSRHVDEGQRPARRPKHDAAADKEANTNKQAYFGFGPVR